MATFSDHPEELPPPGYVSEGARRRYRRDVLMAIGAAFAVAYLAVPLISASLSVGQAMREFFEGMSFVDADSVVKWRGELWYIASARSSPFPAVGTRSGENRLIHITPTGNVAEYVPPPGRVRLAVEGGKLWIISRDGVEAYDGGKVTPLPFAPPSGRMLEPFRLGGRLAVPVEEEDSWAVYVFEGEAWRREAVVNVPRPEPPDSEKPAATGNSLRIVGADDTPYLFLERAEQLYMRAGFPEPGGAFPREWESLGKISRPWDAAVVDGRPLLVSGEWSPRDGWIRLLGRVRDETGWREAFSVGPVGMLVAVAVVPEPEGGATILVQNTPWMSTLYRFQEGRLAGSPRRADLPFPTGAYAVTLALNATPYLIVMVLAAGLTHLIRRYRTEVHPAAGEHAVYASPLRRGLARLVDFLLMGWPFLFLLAFMGRVFGGPDPAATVRGMTVAFVLAVGGLCWSLLLFCLFSVAEGRRGKTPGKWLLGIRVAGTDLRRVGIARAFVRNLLLLVDVFFKGFVGLTFIALTPRFQRLGDLAARSVVLKDGRRREVDAQGGPLRDPYDAYRPRLDVDDHSALSDRPDPR